MTGPEDRLDELVAELETTAQRLRGGGVGGEEAARLVERCAELAGRVASELETRARDAAEEPGPDESDDQERLL